MAIFKRKYKVPIMGKVLNDQPLTGAIDDPICVIPFNELPGWDLDRMAYAYTCLEYNVDEGWCDIELTADEATHDWLLSLMPQIFQIRESKSWKLDKTELEKVRIARGEKAEG